LAADVAQLSGLPPAKAVLLVHEAAGGLLVVAVFALLARRWGPPVAAVAAVLTVAAARVPTAFAAFGDGGPVLALAFVVAAAAWLGPVGGRSSAVAAGSFLATAALSQPVLAVAALAALGLRLRPWRDASARVRLTLAAAVAAVLAAPLLVRMAGAVSAGEAVSAVPGAAPLARAVAASALVAAGPAMVRRLWPPRGAPGAVALLTMALGAAWSVRREWLQRAIELQPSPAERAAIASLASDPRPLDTVCIEPGGAGVWIPALAGRSVSHPWVPAAYRDELAASVPVPCVHARAAAVLERDRVGGRMNGAAPDAQVPAPP
ncbi:MAG TPA: hypothetical protein VLI67_03915, partial [Vicinamibacteria bacterium]|nr:hypothetical protein [Vicinamibacteria bacterium]